MKINQSATYPRNVRLWTPTDAGYARITIPSDGTPVRHHRRWADEEGSGWRYEEHVQEDGVIIRRSGGGGRDCDGVTAHHYVCACPLDRLSVRPGYDDPSVLLPEWESMDESQRDYSAEAAGY